MLLEWYELKPSMGFENQKSTPWTEDVNWTYLRLSEAMDVIRSINVLCPGGRPKIKGKSKNRNSLPDFSEVTSSAS